MCLIHSWELGMGEETVVHNWKEEGVSSPMTMNFTFMLPQLTLSGLCRAKCRVQTSTRIPAILTSIYHGFTSSARHILASDVKYVATAAFYVSSNSLLTNRSVQCCTHVA